MVTVAPPARETVPRYEYFTGRAEAPDSVDIRAQVSGPMYKVYFTPGAEVKEGDPLVEIDPKPFKVALMMAEAQSEAAKARLKYTTAETARLDQGRRTLSVTEEEYQKSVGQKEEAAANINGTTAKIDQAKLDLGYTKINAPLSGVVGDKLVSVGNQIVGGQGNATLITTIVSVDPLYVSFDVDENTLQRVQQAVREGKIKVEKPEHIPVEAALAIHGEKYPIAGAINFKNNKVDVKTGTIRVKATVKNPKTESGSRLITPGNFMRVRIPIGEPAPAMLVPESAILSDLGSKYLLAIGAENKAVRLDATLGPPSGSMRVIDSVQGEGDAQPRPLRPDEQIIISGLQRVHPGLTVDPKPKS
jgi:RND family efflux transporter MFP subunit